MEDFLLLVAVGFAAQLVDGAIGMGHGIAGMTLLLGLGLPPATASASVHVAEVFTTGASGLSHRWFGNVERGVVWRLALPGAAGGGVGAIVLVSAPQKEILLAVSAYLLVMGAMVLWKGFGRKTTPTSTGAGRLIGLGFVGGLLDGFGGGGWGPIVTGTLIGRGMVPRLAIGSSIAAEFFVAGAVSATFIATIGLELWPVIAALIVGGLLAAPLGAYATRHVPDRPMLILVGVVIVLLSLRQILLLLTGG